MGRTHVRSSERNKGVRSMSKTDICILAPVHQYSDIRVFQKEAKTLVENGYNVTLVARIDESSVINGINIVKVPTFASRLKRFLYQPSLIKEVLRTKATIVHLHNPDTIPIGFILKLFGKKVIYDTHEDFSKRILMRDWIPKPLRKTIASIIISLEKLAGTFFDKVIVTQEEVANRIGSNSLLLENAPITHGELIESAKEISKTILRDPSIFRLVYVGGVSNTRGLKQMVEALSIINHSIETRLWLIGPEIEKGSIEAAEKMEGWEYVDYLGPKPQDEAFAYIIHSDVGLITILDIGDHRQTSPNKIFEYQTFGIPYISSDFPKWRNMLESVGSGIFVNPENPQEIADAALHLARNEELRKEIGFKGQTYIHEQYNWEKESKKLLNLYQALEKLKLKQTNN